MKNIFTCHLKRAGKITIPLVVITSTLMLASCGSIYPSQSHPDSSNWGGPQRLGWTTSRQIHEAEQKSIAKDMPFASVTAAGSIVQN